MKWLGVTLGLLAASVCLVGWIYLRDRDTSGWLPPEGRLAHADANYALAELGGQECPSHCSADVLGQTQPHHWLVRFTVVGRPECLLIDLRTFAVSQQHGLSGVRLQSCTGA
jgi:hypothetical protein